MHTTFAAFPVPQLRRIVESIPGRIKEVAKKLQKQTGIIIRDESLKLTPEFLRLMNLEPEGGEKQASKEEKKEEEAKKDKENPEEQPNPKSMISMGGVPFDVLLPLLKKSFNKQELMDERLNRRLTL